MKRQDKPYFNYSRDRACDICGKVPEIMFETRYIFPKVKCACPACNLSTGGYHHVTMVHCMLCMPTIPKVIKPIIEGQGEISIEIDPSEKVQSEPWGSCGSNK